MLTLLVILALGAAVCTVLGAMSKCPWWVPVGLLAIFAVVQVIPTGK